MLECVVVIALHAICTNAIQCERHSFRNIFMRTKQLKISSRDIFCFQRRCNVIFASLKCVKLILQFYIITSLLYIEMHELQQLHNRITSKISFLKILKMRFENLLIFFFENWNFQLIRTNSNRLSSFIHWSRILLIARSIIRSNKNILL